MAGPRRLLRNRRAVCATGPGLRPGSQDAAVPQPNFPLMYSSVFCCRGVLNIIGVGPSSMSSPR